MRTEESPGTTRVLVGLVAILLIAGAAFFLVGQLASRDEGFDWELASNLRHGCGDRPTRNCDRPAGVDDAGRSGRVAPRTSAVTDGISSEHATDPVDAPLDRFTVEKEASGFGAVPIEQGVPRRIEDLGRITVQVGQIDTTYGHLLPDAADHERGLLDAFDARGAGGAESFGR